MSMSTNEGLLCWLPVRHECQDHSIPGLRQESKRAGEEQGDVPESLGVHGQAMPSGDILVFQKVTEKGWILPRRVSHRHDHMN